MFSILTNISVVLHNLLLCANKALYKNFTDTAEFKNLLNDGLNT